MERLKPNSNITQNKLTIPAFVSEAVWQVHTQHKRFQINITHPIALFTANKTPVYLKLNSLLLLLLLWDFTLKPLAVCVQNYRLKTDKHGSSVGPAVLHLEKNNWPVKSGFSSTHCSRSYLCCLICLLLARSSLPNSTELSYRIYLFLLRPLLRRFEWASRHRFSRLHM